MKCDICKKKIEENFLNKLVGAYMKDKEGKRRAVCSGCQTKYKDKTALLAKL